VRVVVTASSGLSARLIVRHTFSTRTSTVKSGLVSVAFMEDCGVLIGAGGYFERLMASINN
jgi:hypothetical protein